MTRRILFVLLGFTAIVLVGAVVPLTLNATSHDRTSFIEAAAGMARTDAVIAQPELNVRYLKNEPRAIRPKISNLEVTQGAAARVTLAQESQQAGYGLLMLTNSGVLVFPSVMPPGNWTQLAQQAGQRAQALTLPAQTVQPVTEIVGSRVIAAMPVLGSGNLNGLWVGTVILTRSTRTLDNEIAALWAILGSIAAGAVIAAALLAFGLARWVSRPLKSLDAAARRLADGDLAIRAKVRSGPPELRRLGTTFNTMAGRLEALVHGNRAVIADVSHQLRTPLAALRLRLDLLAADAAPSNPEIGHELAGALDELARLSRLVDGLLTVARAENVVPVPVAVDVSEVAKERVVAWHPVADDRSIVLVTSSESSGRSSGAPVLAWIGEGHLEQILDNLIANALEALDPGNLVRLTTSATATGARITVSDNGPGMAAEDRERAFLRFTTASPNGTGLGLAIVHRLATSNGGTARLDETPGGGLTVTLDFPGVPAPGSGAPPPTSASVRHDVISL